jgi:hypothetical protein
MAERKEDTNRQENIKNRKGKKNENIKREYKTLILSS